MIRLENLLKTSLEDLLKMSWKLLEDVLQTILTERLENVLQMSWRCSCKKSWRRLGKVWRHLGKISWRRLEDVLKTYDQDEYIGLEQDVLKMSFEDVWLRWIYSSWSRGFKDIFIKTNVCRKNIVKFHNIMTPIIAKIRQY